MALTSTSNFDLNGYQLGVGDLSILAGVGRDVVNWLNSGFRDHSFLEVLGLDSKIVVARRGLLDVTDLEGRWSRRVAIIRDGNVAVYHPDRDRAVKLPQLDYFTWFMTLVTAALSASMLESCVNDVLVNFFISICEDDKQKEYVLRATPKQIQGWKSTATVRGILEAAHTKWKQLEDDRIHQPGLVPAADVNELGMFLRWLAGHFGHPVAEGMNSAEQTANKASPERFRTASSDVWAIAMVLDYLGITMQTVRKTDWYDEDLVAVVFDPDVFVYRGNNLSTKRRGMRINLTSVDEAISLWPGPPAQNSVRRLIFDRGAEAAKALNLVAGQCLTGPDFSQGTYQAMLAVLYKPPRGRVRDEIAHLAREYLLGADLTAIQQLEGLVDSWKLGFTGLKDIIKKLAPYNPRHFSISDVPPNILEDFQIFVLGYYYEATRPLLDTSKMLVVEAFGAWTWNDMEFCELVRRMQKGKADSGSDTGSGVNLYKKTEFLRVMSYLYAGGEMHQIQKIGRSSCGITSKLTLLDSTMMGDTDLPEKICRFCLIDVDGSCFPANNVGIMHSATQPERTFHTLPLPAVEDFIAARQTGPKEDFTSMVEPDWELDTQSCVVAFRHNGRIVSRVSPERIFHAILNGFPISAPIYPTQSVDMIYRYSKQIAQGSRQASQVSGSAYRLDLGLFEGNAVPLLTFPHADSYPLVYVPTSGLVKARTCVAAVYPYEDWYTLERHISRGADRPDGCDDATLVLNHSSYQLLIL